MENPRAKYLKGFNTEDEDSKEVASVNPRAKYLKGLTSTTTQPEVVKVNPRAKYLNGLTTDTQQVEEVANSATPATEVPEAPDKLTYNKPTEFVTIPDKYKELFKEGKSVEELDKLAPEQTFWGEITSAVKDKGIIGAPLSQFTQGLFSKDVSSQIDRGNRVVPTIMEIVKEQGFGAVFAKTKEYPYESGGYMDKQEQKKALDKGMTKEEFESSKETWGQQESVLKQISEVMDEQGDIPVDMLDLIDLPKSLINQLVLEAKSNTTGIPYSVLEKQMSLSGFSETSIMNDFNRLAKINQAELKEKGYDFPLNDVFTIMKTPGLRQKFDLPNNEFEGGIMGSTRNLVSVLDQAAFNLGTKSARVANASRIREQYSKMDSPHLKHMFDTNSELFETYLAKAKQTGKPQKIKIGGGGDMDFYKGTMVITPESSMEDIKSAYTEAYINSTLGTIENYGKRSDTAIVGGLLSAVIASAGTVVKSGGRLATEQGARVLNWVGTKAPWMVGTLDTVAMTATKVALTASKSANAVKGVLTPSTAVKATQLGRAGQVVGNTAKALTEKAVKTATSVGVTSAAIGLGSEQGSEENMAMFSAMFMGGFGVVGLGATALTKPFKELTRSRNAYTQFNQGVASKMANLSDVQSSALYKALVEPDEAKAIAMVTRVGLAPEEFAAIKGQTRSQISAEANILKLYGTDAVSDERLVGQIDANIDLVSMVIKGEAGVERQKELLNLLDTHFISVNGIEPIQYRNMYAFSEALTEVFPENQARVTQILDGVDFLKFRNTEEFLSTLKAGTLIDNTPTPLFDSVANKIGADLTDEHVYLGIFLDTVRQPTTRYTDALAGKTAEIYKNIGTKTTAFMDTLASRKFIIDSTNDSVAKASMEFTEDLAKLKGTVTKDLKMGFDEAIEASRAELYSHFNNAKVVANNSTENLEALSFYSTVFKMNDPVEFNKVLIESPHLVKRWLSKIEPNTAFPKQSEALKRLGGLADAVDELRVKERLTVTRDIENYYANKRLTLPGFVRAGEVDGSVTANTRANTAQQSVVDNNMNRSKVQEALRDAYRLDDVASQEAVLARYLKETISPDEADAIAKKMVAFEEVDFKGYKAAQQDPNSPVNSKSIGFWDALENNYNRQIRAGREIEQVILAGPEVMTNVQKLVQIDLLIGKVNEPAMVRKFVTPKYQDVVTDAMSELAGLPIGNTNLMELVGSLTNNPRYTESFQLGQSYMTKTLENIMHSSNVVTKEVVDVIGKSYAEVTGRQLNVLPFLATFIAPTKTNNLSLELYGTTLHKLAQVKRNEGRLNLIGGIYLPFFGSADNAAKVVGREGGVSIFNGMTAKYNGYIEGTNASINAVKQYQKALESNPRIKKYMSTRVFGDIGNRLEGQKGILKIETGLSDVKFIQQETISHAVVDTTQNVMGDFISHRAPDGSSVLTNTGNIFKRVFIDADDIDNILLSTSKDIGSEALSNLIKKEFLVEIQDELARVNTLLADPATTGKVKNNLLARKALLDTKQLPFLDYGTGKVRGTIGENAAAAYFRDYFTVNGATGEHYKAAFEAHNLTGEFITKVWRESSDIIEKNNTSVGRILDIQIQPNRFKSDYFVGSKRNSQSLIAATGHGEGVVEGNITGRWRATKASESMSQLNKANELAAEGKLSFIQSAQRYAYNRFVDSSTIHANSSLNNKAKILSEVGYDAQARWLAEWSDSSGAPPSIVNTVKSTMLDVMYRSPVGRGIILALTPVRATTHAGAVMITGPARMLKGAMQGTTMSYSRVGGSENLKNLPNSLKNMTWDTFIARPFSKIEENVFSYKATNYIAESDVYAMAEKVAKGFQTEQAYARNRDITYMAGTSNKVGGKLEDIALKSQSGLNDFINVQASLRMKEQVEFGVSRLATNTGAKSFLRVNELLMNGDVIAARKILKGTFRGYSDTDINAVIGTLRKGIADNKINESAQMYLKNYHVAAVGTFGSQSASLHAKKLASLVPGMSVFYSSSMMVPALVLDTLVQSGTALSEKIRWGKFGTGADRVKGAQSAAVIVETMLGFAMAERAYNYGIGEEASDALNSVGMEVPSVVKAGMAMGSPKLALLDGSTAMTQTLMDFGILARRHERKEDMPLSRVASRLQAQITNVALVGAPQAETVNRSVIPFGLDKEIGIYLKMGEVLSSVAAQVVASAKGGEALEYDLTAQNYKTLDKYRQVRMLDPNDLKYIAAMQEINEEYKVRNGSGISDTLAKGAISIISDYGVGNMFRELFNDPVMTYHLITHYNSEELMRRLAQDPEYDDITSALVRDGFFPMGTLLAKSGLDEVLFNKELDTLSGLQQYKFQVASFMSYLQSIGVAFTDREMNHVISQSDLVWTERNDFSKSSYDAKSWTNKDSNNMPRNYFDERKFKK